MRNIYRVELAVNTHITEDIRFDLCKPQILENIKKFSDQSETEMPVILYDVDPFILRFFISFPVYHLQNKTDIINTLKQSILARLNTVEVLADEIIKIKLLKKVKPDYCLIVLNSVLKKDNSLFSSDDLEKFMFSIGIFDLDSKNEEIEDEELSDEELTGIFDGFVENKNEQIQADVPFGWSSILPDAKQEKPNQKFESLIGLEQFKKELYAISRFASLNKKLGSESSRIFPYHYIFSIEPGMGVTTILSTFTRHLRTNGIINSSDFIEYEGSLDFYGNNDSKMVGVFSKGEDGNYRVDSSYGVVAVNISDYLSDPGFHFGEFMDLMWEARGKVVFVLLIDSSNKDYNEKLIRKIKNRVNCHHIIFNPYSDQELLQITRRLCKKAGFSLDSQAEAKILEIIQEERDKGCFENLRTIQKLIEEIRVEKLFNASEDEEISVIECEDIAAVVDDDHELNSNAWSALDEIVGMENVKQRLKEIVSNARVQRKRREAGLDSDEFSYHMVFLGNPGTGKTMVARILGRLFKEIGILKKGEVLEVGRENLVAKYVGHTAPLVRQRVKEAMGSILFIDEAYSLNTGSYGEDKRDFGNEAIEVLLKEMEDKREQFIVIAAGYPNEMEKLLAMNPGLSQRFPNKIIFEDYSSNELLEIFLKCMGQNYILSSDVIEKLSHIFEITNENAGKDFANGRLARNVAERLKMKQSLRLCKENDFSREELMTIELEDVDALFKDEDFRRMIYVAEEKTRKIGF